MKYTAWVSGEPRATDEKFQILVGRVPRTAGIGGM
jgi:hypothetical protein